MRTSEGGLRGDPTPTSSVVMPPDRLIDESFIALFNQSAIESVCGAKYGPQGSENYWCANNSGCQIRGRNDPNKQHPGCRKGVYIIVRSTKRVTEVTAKPVGSLTILRRHYQQLSKVKSPGYWRTVLSQLNDTMTEEEAQAIINQEGSPVDGLSQDDHGSRLEDFLQVVGFPSTPESSTSYARVKTYLTNVHRMNQDRPKELREANELLHYNPDGTDAIQTLLIRSARASKNVLPRLFQPGVYACSSFAAARKLTSVTDNIWGKL